MPNPAPAPTTTNTPTTANVPAGWFIGDILIGPNYVISDNIGVSVPFVATQFEVSLPQFQSITLKYAVQSMTAQISGVSAPMALIPIDWGPRTLWHATLDVSNIPSGTYPLTITIIDAKGNTGTVTKNVVIDRPPVLNIVAPVNNNALILSTTNPIPYNASCSDDYQCVGLALTVVGDKTVVSGINSISGTLDLTPYDGSTITLQYTAADSVGQLTTSNIQLTVDLNPLTSQVTTVPGLIVDTDGNRVLYTDSTSTKLYLYDLSKHTTILLYTRSSSSPLAQYYSPKLTPVGAEWVVYDPSMTYYSELFSFENGNLVDLGTAPGYTNKTQGNFLVWNNPATLYERNLTLGTNTALGAISSNGDNYSLAANGAVAYTFSSLVTPSSTYTQTVYLTQGGVAQVVGTGINARTDGTGVLYINATPSTSTTGVVTPSTLYYANGTNAPMTLGTTVGGKYRINNGWIAYSLSQNGVEQVWRGTPLGTNTQLTFYSTSSSVEALDSSGALVLTANRHRYYVAPNSNNLVDIGTPLGSAVFVSGKLYIYIKGTLLSVAV